MRNALASGFSVLIYLWCWLNRVSGDGDGDAFCSQDAFENENTNSHSPFSKELSSVEFGIRRHPKSLHCCAENYESILWFKDDKMYPWKEGVSNFVIDAKSVNRSIFVPALSREDAGVYSCLIVKNSRKIVRRIPLKVFDSGYSGIPVSTFAPPTSLPVIIGDTVKLYCEAFVGKIDLPDAQNKIDWFKVAVNNTRIALPLPNNSRTRVKKIIRDDGSTLGLYLLVENVKSSDYGRYVCSVSNAADQITEVQTQLMDAAELSVALPFDQLGLILLYAVCVSILTTAIAFFIFYKYGYQIQLCALQYIAYEKNDDSKDYDVFILYEMKEISFVTGVLTPTLCNEYDYAISSHALECDVAVNMECQARIAASRSVLLVLSCPVTDDAEHKKRFFQKLYTASNLHTKVVCLLVVENPVVRFDKAEVAKFAKWSALIEWPTFKKDHSKSWLLLRLNLPIKRRNFTANIRRYSTVNDRHIVCTL